MSHRDAHAHAEEHASIRRRVHKFFIDSSTIKSTLQPYIIGAVNDFDIQLRDPLFNIVGVHISSVFVNGTINTVRSGANDKVYWRYFDNIVTTQVTTTIPVGNYTAAALGVILAAQMSADSVKTITVVYSGVTEKYTFTITNALHTMAFTFATNTGTSANKLIGFNAADGTLAAFKISDNIAEVTIPLYAIIRTNLRPHTHDMRTGNTSVLARVPLSAAGTVTYWQNSQDEFLTVKDHSLRRLQCQIADPDGALISFAGGNSNWGFEIEVETIGPSNMNLELASSY